jgi:hypothetical protein
VIIAFSNDKVIPKNPPKAVAMYNISYMGHTSFLEGHPLSYVSDCLFTILVNISAGRLVHLRRCHADATWNAIRVHLK